MFARRDERVMRPKLATVLMGFLLAGLWEAGGQSSAGRPDLGVSLYPGSTPAPEIEKQLEGLRNIRWLAMGVFRTEAPLRRVIEHFRGEQAKPSGSPETSRRLKEWLDKNPDELAKYRDLQRSQAGSAPADWQVSPLSLSEVPASLGGGEKYRASRFVGRKAETAYGRILLPESAVSVQLLSPHPSAEAQGLSAGTLIALIRESSDAGAAASGAPAPETVKGPETVGLASRLSGFVVMDRPVGGMDALAVPGGRRLVVRPPGSTVGVVHSLAGPDAEGRIAYVENHAAEGRHSLKTIRIDGGQDERVFSRPGDAFFERAIGSSLALSPSGGMVALVGRLSRFQTNRPPFPLRIGPLEIWDVRKKSGREVGVFALDRRISWFPDGRRFAYVELVPREKVELPSGGGDRFGAGFSSWEAVPVVRVFELDSGGRVSLHAGWDPVVSSDGKSVLVRDAEGRSILVDVETGRSQPVEWPGDAGGAIALSEGGLVLYWGLPTEGAPPEFTQISGSALGPRPMKTLKVAALGTGNFETLLPTIDPRRDVAFGQVPAVR